MQLFIHFNNHLNLLQFLFIFNIKEEAAFLPICETGGKMKQIQLYVSLENFLGKTVQNSTIRLKKYQRLDIHHLKGT